jgi:regulator of sigma E protease
MTIITIIYFILVLGVTVFIHEFGHFIFAKKAGVYVYEFSIGMGPIIIKKKRKNDETNYCLRLFPIGGFVAMAGEDTLDEEIDKEKQLVNKSWNARFLTIIAGVLFNFLLALVLLFITGIISGVPKNEIIVNRIEEGYALSNTNMAVDDKIIALDGKNVTTIDKLSILLALNNGEEVKFKVEHKNGDIEEIEVAPTKVEEEGTISYRFGFEIANNKTRNIASLITYPFTKTYSLLEQMVFIIKNLIIGKLSLKNLSGPIGIYTIVDQSWKAGFVNILYLIAYLCINVGFINILPFPAFDGGRAFFLILEKIRGKAINSKTENLIHTVGFYLLLLLMIIIAYNDITRLL